MNEVLRGIFERRSVRSYKKDQIPDDVMDRILKAGTYAASGRNKQASIIIAVTDKDTRDKLAKLNARVMGNENADPFYGAPAVIVVLADKSVRTHVYDGSLVMGNLMLAAHAEGLGSCWIHRAKEVFETEEGLEILRSLGISGDYEGVGNCILGYPEGEIPAAAERKENYIYYIK